MGHHSVYCAITQAPITGSTRCVAVWAKPRQFQDRYSGLSPVSIFYRGSYDDYGRIDIDETEKYQELLNDLDQDNPSMFILESVYDELDKFSVGRYGSDINTGSAYDNSDLTAYNLKLLGFELQEKESGDKRYKTVFKHPSEPDKEVWSDGRWSQFPNSSGVYYWKDFEKHFPNVDYTVLHNISHELNSLNAAYEEYLEDKKFYESIGASTFKYVTEKFAEHNFLSIEMIPYLEHVDFREKVAKIMRVYWFMYANYLRFGVRTFCGPQDGNLQASIKRLELTKLALDAQVKEQEEYEKEWEDDNE